MDQRKEQEILRLVTVARESSDAFIVVGILPGGRFFYSCDDHITLPDLHGALQDNVNAICESVSHFRARKSKERKMA